ncbi:hypothetical protein SAMN05216386_2117 [Nitrosospira briensis]|uniref:Uncharacterized protein n=1 Tax=Nitrosospira briensis TaxID=35799 RepID=A0A1I5CS43_9PROT|nr:hypothetical protein SAMN05216386_2117 [Nitrosospira briensis]
MHPHTISGPASDSRKVYPKVQPSETFCCLPRDAFNLAVVALNAAGVTPRVIEWIEFILSTKKVINKEIAFLLC